MLERWGFPIPRSLYLDSGDFSAFDALLFDRWKFPVVIKPIDEAHGNGVCMGIIHTKELSLKLQKSFEKYPRMIVQEQISGDECRFVVMFGEMVLAINRIPPEITGDGEKSISELIQQENDTNPLRSDGYNSALSYISIDEELREYITKK